MSHKDDVGCFDAQLLTRSVQFLLPPVPGLPAWTEDQEEDLAAGLHQGEDGRPEKHDLVIRVSCHYEGPGGLIEMLQ